VVARRGYGGLAIFWKKEIDDKIKVMDEGNSRIQVIHIDTNASPICLINGLCRSCLRYILFPFTLCTLNVPIVISVAFSSLLGLSLKNGFDYYYSAIQEHWLFKPEQNLLQNIEANMTVVAKSVDDDCPELSVVALNMFLHVEIM
jgi:hypothetical protein